MKQAGIQEFRDHATTFISGQEPVEVTNHGRTVGYYIPVPQKTMEERRAALERLEAAVRRVLEESGLTEKELVQELSDWKS